MTLTAIEKQARHLWHQYGTLNNVVMGVALCVAASWAWGTVVQMQTNFAAQKAVDEQERNLQLTELQVAKLKYERNYYKSDEYKGLAARTKLGLVSAGERVLVLPPNTQAVKDQDAADERTASGTVEQSAKGTNLEQWMQFLTGQSARGLQG